MDRSGVLRMYRNLLKVGRKYPSKNQQRIYDEIKVAFRESRTVSDSKELSKLYEDGNMAYSHMKMYVDAVPSGGGQWGISWTLESIQKRYESIPWNHDFKMPSGMKW